MSKHGQPPNPSKPTPRTTRPATGGEQPVSPYLRRPLRKLEEVESRPDTGDRPDNASKPRKTETAPMSNALRGLVGLIVIGTAVSALAGKANFHALTGIASPSASHSGPGWSDIQAPIGKVLDLQSRIPGLPATAWFAQSQKSVAGDIDRLLDEAGRHSRRLRRRQRPSSVCAICRRRPRICRSASRPGGSSGPGLPELGGLLAALEERRRPGHRPAPRPKSRVSMSSWRCCARASSSASPRSASPADPLTPTLSSSASPVTMSSR